MLYDYYCEECGNELKDVQQSIKDDALITCPDCGKDALNRVIYGGIGCFVKDMKTLGQVGDKNWSNMGHYKRSEIEMAAKEKSEKETPYFSSFGSATPANRKQINKMTPAQKKKYIMGGET
jgi:putative FmdB family regulatory protein